ncbi:DUF4411 family protein [Lapillicoccus sp.]|uniref:DUF4411 family protein n=1 Tax=Lapillicoccus sp. TaxID=1909287 RepID=UPI0025EA85BE|nr:DUF4411 family protein [Lapillicoccus sp.]
MYLIDSDVLIDAKNHHYGFDLVPGFWDWLAQAHVDGRVFTVAQVVDEILAGGDELSEWMDAQPNSFKLQPQASDAPSLQRVAEWAVSAPYRQGAADTFLATGDYFLVSQARSLGYTVVTREKPAPQSEKRIKIPDACNAVGVPWTSLFDMLKTEGARFGLA